MAHTLDSETEDRGRNPRFGVDKKSREKDTRIAGTMGSVSDLNMAFYEHYVYQGSWHSFSRQRLQLLGGVSGNLFP